MSDTNLRLRELRRKAGLSMKQLGDLFSVSEAAISFYETGKRQLSLDLLTKFANYFNVSVDYLLGNSDETSSPVWVPVLGSVQAGVPSEAIQDITDYEDISNITSCGQDYFALKIKGSSMEPRFLEGDVVIVKKQSDVKDGEIAIVLVNGDEATCKKIKKTPQGVMLIPLNSAFETMLYSDEEILSLPVVIIGKVVELRAKF